MIYYIDPVNGNDSFDGLSEGAARRSYTDLGIRPGDSVLFRRGSFIRDCLYTVAGSDDGYVTYGAYGEGNAPVFCGSVDVSDARDWREVRENVWEYTKPLEREACNFIFNNSLVGATLRWEEELLREQGDWYDSRMGTKGEEKEQRVLLYSKGNPGKVYSHIECAVWGQRKMAQNRDRTVIEDLCFFGSGVHGMAGGAKHVTVRHCSFLFIGGAVWSRKLRIRFGNGIEFWNTGEDVLIEDCYFNNIYDSCITQQGAGDACTPARDIEMRHNLFANYGMAAYEGRDLMPVNCSFHDNVCLYAGGGFTGFGDTKPRSSEIWPQPMGHHVFMWRITRASEGGLMEIKNNLFYESTGAAVYAIISADADAQMPMEGNTYYTSEPLLVHRVETSYSTEEWKAYGERGAGFRAIDPDAAAEEWSRATGTYRPALPAIRG